MRIWIIVLLVCLTSYEIVTGQQKWTSLGLEAFDIQNLSVNENGELIASTNNTLEGSTTELGLIFYSDDYGLSWRTLSRPGNAITALVIDDEGVIYAGDADGLDLALRVTTDLGQTWHSLQPNQVNATYMLKSTGERIYSSFVGNALGDFLYHSKDNGKTWNSEPIDFMIPFTPQLDVISSDPSHELQYILGIDLSNGKQSVYRATMHENNWIIKSSGLLNSVYSMFVARNGNLLAQSGDPGHVGELFLSMDHGEHWEHLKPNGMGPNYFVTKIVEDTSGQYFALVQADNFMSGVYRSSDEGKNWERIIDGLPDTEFGATPNNLIMTPDDKIICATSKGLYTWGESIVTGSESSLTDYKVYPNPASDFLIIEGGETSPSNITFYTQSGARIKTIQTLGGSLPLLVDVTDLSDGIYLVTITTSKTNVTYRQVKKK